MFAIGAVGYEALEVLWRGNSHWTMGLAGGTCLLTFYRMWRYIKDLPVWRKCAIGAGVITGVEFCFGVVVNLVLKWNVWDYSGMRFNILGQVCALYTGLWFLLCIPVMKLVELLDTRVFHRHLFW